MCAQCTHASYDIYMYTYMHIYEGGESCFEEGRDCWILVCKKEESEGTAVDFFYDGAKELAAQIDRHLDRGGAHDCTDLGREAGRRNEFDRNLRPKLSLGL
mmetsp:Transcript_84079/g.122946  ORF Transcript_84079/g.122946 Transcript_84079/m.122946 type:complete len:101 (+) Transcript_84079:387-689(+)